MQYLNNVTRNPIALGTLTGLLMSILLYQMYKTGTQSINPPTPIQTVLADGQATTITKTQPTSSGDLIIEEGMLIRIGTPTDRDDLVFRAKATCKLPICTVPAQSGIVLPGGSIDSQQPGTITTIKQGTGYLVLTGTIDQNQPIKEAE